MKSFDVVVATASPRRRELIKRIKCVNPVFMTTNVEETVLPGAAETAMNNARLKGEHARKLTTLPVLAFDTVVELDGKIYGKPTDAASATEMLKSLCGRTHFVYTAVYFDCDGQNIFKKIQKTAVTFGTFDRDLVYNYVASGAPFDKAGGYNIDDAAIKPLIVGIDGDYDNVVGLPIALTEKLLEESNFYAEDKNRS